MVGYYRSFGILVQGSQPRANWPPRNPGRFTTVVRLTPFVQFDQTAFTTSRENIVVQFGPPQQESRNSIGLNELDYGDTVFRFQDNGRLEEITRRAPALTLGNISVPFSALGAFIQANDPDAFKRAGFLVSPAYGIAFVPTEPNWVTALAKHCIPQWQALQSPQVAQPNERPLDYEASPDQVKPHEPL
jgi:hypothetical protein